MEIQLAKRMEAFKPSIFSKLAAYKKEKLEQGCDIVDLSVGSPDLSPPQFIMDELAEEVKKDQYGYTLSGIDEFAEAVADYYKESYNVSLNPKDEVLQLMGSQDGLVHLPMVFANSGDYILVPDPGYTAYATGVAMAGAECYLMPLLQENNYLPDLKAIPAEIAAKAKMIILNYPGNPIPTLATESFFVELVAFAKKYNIIVLHDFAYSEIYYDGKKPVSFLSVPGAKEVGMEINSLSKGLNLAGTRIGYLMGNKDMIKAFAQLKSNLDYGVFFPVQKAAATSLRHAKTICTSNRIVYQKRRDLLVNGLRSIGWNVDAPEGGMFVWGKIPEGWNSTDFAFTLIDKANVVVTPGVAFGPSGEGYVRIALVQSEEKLQKAVSQLPQSGLFLQPSPLS
ncbi:LL-diaminopimelate aminotransferase [Bacillus aquiflavi]|uniref:LL-diaminopimelate aminotransferase n=1 Tax=Bacillus aquiflavi TaxID=2672567 RepID=UPI001CA7F8E8|nr:LL-diaminopimelate aminotransferase [Bacillus aquiflavi]UAC49590.1 LL-diaminopimelate aminotransferase [Bacillus aquiflavi]